MKQLMKNEDGFTLIEMVFVVLIIAALLLIFVPNISKTREKAVDKSEEAVVKVVETQKEAYLLENGGDSVSVEQLVNSNYITEEQLEIYNQSVGN